MPYRKPKSKGGAAALAAAAIIVPTMLIVGIVVLLAVPAPDPTAPPKIAAAVPSTPPPPPPASDEGVGVMAAVRREVESRVQTAVRFLPQAAVGSVPAEPLLWVARGTFEAKNMLGDTVNESYEGAARKVCPDGAACQWNVVWLRIGNLVALDKEGRRNQSSSP